jgi:hypothetical protein
MTRNHKIAYVINFLIDGEELMPWKHKTYSEEKFIYFNLTMEASDSPKNVVTCLQNGTASHLGSSKF